MTLERILIVLKYCVNQVFAILSECKFTIANTIDMSISELIIALIVVVVFLRIIVSFAFRN